MVSSPAIILPNLSRDLVFIASSLGLMLQEMMFQSFDDSVAV